MKKHILPSIAGRTLNTDQQATAFLREHGYTWAAKPKQQVDARQSEFERRVLVQNMRGNVGERRR